MHSIRTDGQEVDFMRRMVPNTEVVKVLETCQRNYLGQIALQSFRSRTLTESGDALVASLGSRNIDSKERASTYWGALSSQLKEQEKVANKFITLLCTMLRDKEALDYSKVCERTKAAVAWFLPRLEEEVLLTMQEHIEAWAIKKRTKKYVQELRPILLDFRRK